jgi:hypothetical protein
MNEKKKKSKKYVTTNKPKQTPKKLPLPTPKPSGGRNLTSL